VRFSPRYFNETIPPPSICHSEEPHFFGVSSSKKRPQLENKFDTKPKYARLLDSLAPALCLGE
jgi:hypothetical protein